MNIAPKLSDGLRAIVRFTDDDVVHKERCRSARPEIIGWNRGRLQPRVGDKYAASRALMYTSPRFRLFIDAAYSFIDGRRALVAFLRSAAVGVQNRHDIARCLTSLLPRALASYPAGRFIVDDR